MAASTVYAFKYVGNVTSEAAIVKSLKGGGPMVVANDHLLVTMLPDAFEDAATAGHKNVHMQQLEAMSMDGLLFERDVSNGGTHLIVVKDRWIALFRDVDTGGMDTTPIAGDATVAIPIAAQRMAATLKM